METLKLNYIPPDVINLDLNEFNEGEETSFSKAPLKTGWEKVNILYLSIKEWKLI